MFAGFDAGLLVDFFQMHIGGLYFGPLDTCILFLALAAAALSALNLWRIGECEAREKRLFQALRGDRVRRAEETQISGPPWYQRFGTKIAATRIIGTAKQESLLTALVAAGVKGHGHLAALIAAKVCGGAASVPLCWVLLEWRSLFGGVPTLKLPVLAGAFILGWR